MRIVSGRYAGRDLQGPKDSRVRPTAEHVRVALLDLVTRDLDGGIVLDLFAGTGALGLEAISRGAVHADFVEIRPSSLHALRTNIAALRLRTRTRIIRKDAVQFAAALAIPGHYAVAFADPPYASRQLDRVIGSWEACPFARVLVAEHASTHRLPEGGRRMEFDDTAVTVYRA